MEQTLSKSQNILPVTAHSLFVAISAAEQTQYQTQYSHYSCKSFHRLSILFNNVYLRYSRGELYFTSSLCILEYSLSYATSPKAECQS